MSTLTQYNPNKSLNETLLAMGASKTVYALVTPEIEAVKTSIFNSDDYLDQFRDAWTGKQDRYHEEFFDAWHHWSKPLVELDRNLFPFYYPTAGASEPLRHIIFDFAAKGGKTIHVFEGEYEGYKAMAEAAGLVVIEHIRDGKDGWHTPFGLRSSHISKMSNDLFFISQPSAIDGNVWADFNEFISKMPENSVVVDLTYVGAVPACSKFNMNQPAVRNVVFSLSKPFGAYYDRIGGVFCRVEDAGLFGNKWFKSLTALNIGTKLMEKSDVFYMPTKYRPLQIERTTAISEALGHHLEPSDVFILANGNFYQSGSEITKYIRRSNKIRVCLTPGMASIVGAKK